MIKTIYKNRFNPESPSCKVEIKGLEETELYKKFRKWTIDTIAHRACGNYSGMTFTVQGIKGLKALNVKIESLKEKRVNLVYYPTAIKVVVTEIKDGASND